MAVGWSTERLLSIVAPSLVTMTSPLLVYKSLSMPFGPKEVLIMSAIAFAASILDNLTSSLLVDLF